MRQIWVLMDNAEKFAFPSPEIAMASVRLSYSRVPGATFQKIEDFAHYSFTVRVTVPGEEHQIDFTFTNYALQETATHL